MGKFGGVVQFLLVALCVIAGVANGVAMGDGNRPTGNVCQQVEKANTATESRFEFVANSCRQHVADLRNVSRLKKVAADAAGFDEKLAHGFSLFDGTSTQVDRMRVSLRKHVVDERALAKSMADAFAAYQKELLDATVTLYGNTGIDKAAARKAFPPATLDSEPLERAFDAVVKKANSLANEDWFRFGLVNVGSDIVADGIEQIGRSSGAWNVEEGSLSDFFAGLVTQLAVEAIADELTDPTDQFAKELQTSMATAEGALLDGPNGLISAMRSITTLHQQSRLKHHGLVQKGGKK